MSNLPTIIPEAQEWATMKEMSKVLIGTGFLPASIKTPQQAVAIMLKGRELKMPAMQAMSHIHVIKGKPTLSAEGMLALIYRECPSAEIIWTERSNKVAACKVRRSKDTELQTFSFSIEDAKQAGLLNNPSWSKYPRAMLHARCVSEVARSVFPDAIMGCSYTPEELGAEVNSDGEVIEVQEVKAEPVEQEPSEEIYMATTKQKEDLKTAFGVKKVPQDMWAAISSEMYGKPFTDEELDKAIAKAEASDEAAK